MNKTISVAPMMDCTDKHEIYFLSLISKNVHLYTEMIVANAILRGDRNKLLSYLNKHHIGASIYYKKPIHLQKVVLDRYNKISLKNTERISKSVISLPFYSFPKDGELEYLITKLNKFI